jgi:DHA1 family bicyclomycin/chloramphenicol resistance-like MFS transporter
VSGAARNRITVPQLLTLALLAAISPLATAMYLPAMPAMAEDLQADPQTVQLTITTFLVGLAVGQLVIGPLSDRTGRRPLLLACTGLCVAASAACAFAPGIELLLVARLLQGLAGAAGIVLGRAIVADTLRENAAARAFSLLMTIGAIAPVVAPLLGGSVDAVIGWRGVYVVLTGFALMMLAGSVFFLPESLPAAQRRPGAWREWARDVASIVTGRRFVAYTAVLVFTYATLIAYVSASPFVLQEDFGLSPTDYAIVFAANAGGLTLASFANARLVRRFAPGRILAVGLIGELCAVLVLLVATLTVNLTVPLLLSLLWLSVACLGLIMGNATSLALDQAAGGVGSASAVIGAAQFALAAMVASLAAGGPDGGAIAMAVTMAGCASIATVAFIGARRTRRGATSGAR